MARTTRALFVALATGRRVKNGSAVADEMKAVAMTVSQPVRIAALLGLVGALALGGMFVMLGRKSATPAPPRIIPRHLHTHPAAKAVHTPIAKAGQTQAKPTTSRAGKPVASGRTTPSVAANGSAEVAALKAALPMKLAPALGRHAVVVVELVNPQSEVDAIAYAEAMAGAKAAGAGFIALNVLSQADIAKLTETIGEVLPDPGRLVYARPARLAVRLDGFNDKATVAQAAQNAALGS